MLLIAICQMYRRYQRGLPTRRYRQNTYKALHHTSSYIAEVLIYIRIFAKGSYKRMKRYNSLNNKQYRDPLAKVKLLDEANQINAGLQHSHRENVSGSL